MEGMDWLYDEIMKSNESPKKKVWESRRQPYVDEFLSLKCCGDVLNVVNPLGKNARKEITESMALLKQIKKVVLNRPYNFKVLDMCAGNALTSILSVHMFPNVEGIAFDIRDRKREWSRVKRFDYIFGDIYAKLHLDFLKNRIIDRNTVIISAHPCGQLAREIVKIYKESNAKALFIMPCCDGKMTHTYPDFFRTKLGNYWLWCWDLAQEIKGKLYLDDKCLSPKNVIISHVRGK